MTWGELLPSKVNRSDPDAHKTSTISPRKQTNTNQLNSSPVMWKITDHSYFKKPYDGSGVNRQSYKAGKRLALRGFMRWPRQSVSGCSVQRLKIHKNVEQLIYHPLHVACTSVSSLLCHLKHITSSLLCVCANVSFLPWWGHYLDYLTTVHLKVLTYLAMALILFWFITSPLALWLLLK